jgi:hypothetical protein
MGSDQRRQRCAAALSDKAASCGAATTARLVLACAGALLAAGPALAAREPDPLHSPACEQARAELDAALAAQDDVRHGARLRHAREQALHACLGNDTGRRERSGAPAPAQAVAPTIPREPARAVLPIPAARAAPPPPDVPRAAMITNCEPGGCWDTRGRRFDRAGPLLVGPNGCQAQGGLVSCP